MKQNHIPTDTDQLKADEALMLGYDDLANKIRTRENKDGSFIDGAQHKANLKEVDLIVKDINKQKI
jgi:hypothetical protein